MTNSVGEEEWMKEEKEMDRNNGFVWASVVILLLLLLFAIQKLVRVHEKISHGPPAIGQQQGPAHLQHSVIIRTCGRRHCDVVTK